MSRTANMMNTAGRKEELAYQTVQKGQSLKRDIEASIVSANAATAGAAASARLAAGMETWIYIPNHVNALLSTGAAAQTGSTTPVPAAGIAGTAGTDGSLTALTEVGLKAALQKAWSAGGETDVILVPPVLKNKIDQFTGIAQRFRNVGAGSQAEIIGAADVYVSSYGSHDIELSRYMRASAVLCLDMSTWGLAWFDPIHQESIGKLGDSEGRFLVGEWTLVAKSPRANTKITNVT